MARWCAALVLIAAGVAAVSLVALGSPGGQGSIHVVCPGVDRWDVKTTSDPARNSIDATHPQVQTIAWLGAQQHGPIGRHTPRIAPFETTVFIVKGVTLVEAKQEGDLDIHLVIKDAGPSANQMIVEFPNIACSVKRFKTSIGKARAAVLNWMTKCGHVDKNGWTQLTGFATIKGVGFFDLVHGTKQHGVAPNDAELHPALKFTPGKTC